MKKTCCGPKNPKAFVSSSSIGVGSKSVAKKPKVPTLPTIQPQVPLRRSLRLEKVKADSGISLKSLEISRKTRSTKTRKKNAKDEKLKTNIPANATALLRSNRSYEYASIDKRFKCPAPVSNQNRGPILKRRTSISISKVRPVVCERVTPIREDLAGVHMAKKSLSVAPKTLPCREKEFKDIFAIIENTILDRSSG